MINASNYGGTTGTSGTGAVVAIAAGPAYHHFEINNTGNAAGTFSVDGGTVWHYLPASGSVGAAVIMDGVTTSAGLQLQRIGGTDMSGVYVSAW